MATLNSNRSFSTDSHFPNCSPFLNCNEEERESELDKAYVLRSLVATVTLHPALENSLEAKAVKFLESIVLDDEATADVFLGSQARNPDESLTSFVQSIVVLLSSASLIITTTAMKILKTQIQKHSTKVRLALVKVDLIPQIIITLNPHSLSFTEAVDIHIKLLEIIIHSVWLSTPTSLTQLTIEDHNEQQAVRETVLKQVLVPSEKYIHHLFTNRISITDRELSDEFMDLLSSLLQISPYYQPTMEFVLHMPIFLAIPSCLTFFENGYV
ncbi:hypothetical protein BLNAU_1153 [Blattamonas nauphoetae]|uniref:Uncharacterized protein n=1 Tax=Blattamonas nauphoetae TaxID=2049346 RepID=A0ABQ9YJY6_9EUKA|nr:hypothetical protein BLNAU_1153 [Blattamonas nauphoetae]